MPLDCIGDDIVFGKEVVGRLTGMAAKTTTLRKLVEKALRGEDLKKGDPLDDIEDHELVHEILLRDLVADVLVELDTEELEEALDERSRRREHRRQARRALVAAASA